MIIDWYWIQIALEQCMILIIHSYFLIDHLDFFQSILSHWKPCGYFIRLNVHANILLVSHLDMWTSQWMARVISCSREIFSIQLFACFNLWLSFYLWLQKIKKPKCHVVLPKSFLLWISIPPVCETIGPARGISVLYNMPG